MGPGRGEGGGGASVSRKCYAIQVDEESKVSKQIALFNHKGGVSKTTTTFNLGWQLAALGKTVVLVDADPQSNLTGLVLGYCGPSDLEDFYQNEGTYLPKCQGTETPCQDLLLSVTSWISIWS